MGLSRILALLPAAFFILSAPPVHAAFPGTNGKIAFQTASSIFDQQCEDSIRVIEPAGTGLETLIAAHVEPWPSWSPDGQRIAYVVMPQQGWYQIWVADADGGGAEMVAVGKEPSWSRDGTRLVFRKPNWTLAIKDLDSLDETPLTILEGEYDQHSEPSWDPTGDRIVFKRSPAIVDEELWIVSADGSGMRRLTTPADNEYDRNAEWSPDGQAIVFERETSNLGGAQLFTVDPEGGEAAQVTELEPPLRAQGPAWSPDGTTIAYLLNDSVHGGGDLWMTSVGSGNGERVTTLGGCVGNGPLEWQRRGSAFVVNTSNSDAGDVSAGDGECDTGADLPGGKPACTLRAAIEESNAHAGKDVITFDALDPVLSGEGRLDVTDPVLIDGSTHPTDHRIVLLNHWLFISAGGTTIRGLAVWGYGTPAITLTELGGNVIEDTWLDSMLVESGNNRIGGSSHDPDVCNGSCNAIRGGQGIATCLTLRGVGATGNLIYGNFIGLTPNGDPHPQGERQDFGIKIIEGASANVIGGPEEGQGNVISGSDSVAVLVTGGDSNRIEGNRIGTEPDGAHEATSTQAAGVEIAGSDNDCTNNQVGGNLISGFYARAVGISGPTARNNAVYLNLIGTAADGVSLIGSGDGVEVQQGAADNLVVGNNVAFADRAVRMFAATGTLVAFNTLHDSKIGVQVLPDTVDSDISNNEIHDNEMGISVEGDLAGETVRNRISANTIHDNRSTTLSGLGIDLGADGPTSNDVGDADSGPNDRLNFPVFSAATVVAGGGLHVEGSFDTGIGARAYTIELFANSACDASGYGEGERFLGFIAATTDFSGRYVIDDTLPDADVQSREIITATATDDKGSTSEFCECIQALPGGTTTTTLPAQKCGDPINPMAPLAGVFDITASDALFALKAAVGSVTCELCVCDVNDSSNITASDALAILRDAVGLPIDLQCPPC
ncbi:MAG: PD40 domain-containing protein [Deltaproteobacteria bacterium]|nr:PD40 domain-containing protein [Deltaproteobacteria bacterium]